MTVPHSYETPRSAQNPYVSIGVTAVVLTGLIYANHLAGERLTHESSYSCESLNSIPGTTQIVAHVLVTSMDASKFLPESVAQDTARSYILQGGCGQSADGHFAVGPIGCQSVDAMSQPGEAYIIDCIATQYEPLPFMPQD